MALKFLSKTVSGASAPTALSATRIACGAIYIETQQDNSDIVWVGDSTVDEILGNGKRLEVPAGDDFTLPSWSIAGGLAPNGNNLADIYIVSASANQKVNVFYEEV